MTISAPLRALPLCVLLPLAAMAEDTPTPAPAPTPTTTTTVGEPVTVVGTQEPQDRIAPVVGPTTGMDRAQVVAAPSIGLVGDAANHLTGVYMDGPAGRNAETHLRGLDSQFSRVTVGGLDIPDGDEDRQFQLDHLSPFAVEGITVQRNQSAAVESDGLAGRVDLQLRPIPEHRLIEADAGVGYRDHLGEQGSYHLSFGIGDRPSTVFGYQVFADLQRLPLNKEKESTAYNPDGTVKSTSESGGQTPDVTGSVLGDFAVFTPGGEIHLQPLLLTSDEDKPKTTWKRKPGKNPTRQDEAEDSHSDTFGAALTGKRGFADGAGWSNTGSAYATTDTSHKDKLDYTVKPAGDSLDDHEVEDEVIKDRTIAYQGDGSLPLATPMPMRLQGGLKVRSHGRDHRISTVSYDPTGVPTDESAAQYNYELVEWYYAGYLQDTITLTHGLDLTAGVRLENVALNSVAGDGTRGTSLATDINPSVALNWQPARGWEGHAAFSRTLARPEFSQLTPFAEDDDDHYTLGNPDLTATWAWSYDLGGSWHGPEDTSLGVNLFYRDVHGLIEAEDTGTLIAGLPALEYRNVGDGWVRGIELDQRVGLGVLSQGLAPLSLWANQAFLGSSVDTDQGKRSFQLQPRVILNFGVDVAIAPTGTALSVSVKCLGTRSEYDLGETTDYAAEWTIDAGIHQQLTNHFAVRLDAVNLTSTDTRGTTIDLASGTVSERSTEADFRYVMLTGEARF